MTSALAYGSLAPYLHWPLSASTRCAHRAVGAGSDGTGELPAAGTPRPRASAGRRRRARPSARRRRLGAEVRRLRLASGLRSIEVAERLMVSQPRISHLENPKRLLNARVPDLHQLAIDGRFGPVTDGRVREFQSRVAIVVDGVVGPQTWGHLTQ
ncbi:peptidoglycan-binding protein [Streptomyces sp. NPDC051001]|uniref:peptidoglycan-binding protein n=1 Tax=Streptomyces sp. NPDC051001 TaxID=3155795 RepID=UPI0034227291